jgi:tetratricopeptide (TPR) repeat protein
MHKALINSNRFIAVLSPDYLASLYCQTEWTAAFIKDPKCEKRLFIPVRVADIKPEGLFAPITYIDLYGIADEKTAEKCLLNGVDIKDIPRNRPSYPGTQKVRFPNSLPFNNLPYIRNNYFTGRNTTLENISKEFDTGNAVSLTQTITGLGGIGKTQTALEYAYRYSEKYDWSWWINAETETTVMKAYQDFALKMKLVDASQQDAEIILETVLTWMDTHEKWLFIYDNLDSVSDDAPWWPRNNQGNILITTRNQRLSIGKGIDITVFTEEEAVSFLEKRTGICNDPQNAAMLSYRLGCLPLALEQAAAYIKNTLTFPEYLMLLENHGLMVLAETDGVIDYSRPVTATWEITFDKISLESAKQLLYLCAYMASENIDSGIFSETAPLLPTPLCNQLSDDLTAISVWKELTKYSLLQKQGDTQNYSMHRLLQEVVREKISADSTWAQCCQKLLQKTFKFDYGSVPSHKKFIKLLPHMETFLINVITYLTEDAEQIEIATLFTIGGFGQYHLGNYSQAILWYQKALAIYEKVLGVEHPYTATTYNNLGYVYHMQGMYSMALESYQKALAINEKVLGIEHPNTAATYNNIAIVYDHQGKYSKALEWYENDLMVSKKVLGEEHPDTAITYNNIAGVYNKLCEYPKALEWYQKALVIIEKVYGIEHPDTAIMYNNIALVYTNQCKYSMALEWFRKALAISEKILGTEHPDIANTYNNIAMVFDKKGEYSKAVECYQKAYDILKVKLGKDHPNTMLVNENFQRLQDEIRPGNDRK